MEIGKPSEVPRQGTDTSVRFDPDDLVEPRFDVPFSETDDVEFDPDDAIDPVDLQDAPEWIGDDDFDPDEAIHPDTEFDGSEIESEDVDQKDGSDVKPAAEAREVKLYTTREERIKIARGSKGEWSNPDDPGNSEFTPADEEVRKTMAGYGEETVSYKDGVVDFSPFAEESVTIDITSNMPRNKRAAYKVLADRFSKQAKDGNTSWTYDDIDDWKKKEQLEFHECSDGKTVLFIPADIHQACKHAGGRMEANRREQAENGGGFDD